MRYPLFLDLRGRRVVVVGGGTVGSRRAQGLLDAGAHVVVIDPDPSPQLPGDVDVVQRFEVIGQKLHGCDHDVGVPGCRQLRKHLKHVGLEPFLRRVPGALIDEGFRVLEVPLTNFFCTPNHWDIISLAAGAAASAPKPPSSIVTAMTIGRCGSGA